MKNCKKFYSPLSKPHPHYRGHLSPDPKRSSSQFHLPNRNFWICTWLGWNIYMWNVCR